MALCKVEMMLADKRLKSITNPTLKIAELKSQLTRCEVIEEEINEALKVVLDRKCLLSKEIDDIIKEIKEGGENDNVGTT